MSDEPPKRQPIASLAGQSSEGNGAASLLVYSLGSQIEIVIGEERGADASVLLSRDQAFELCGSVTAEIDGGLGPEIRRLWRPGDDVPENRAEADRPVDLHVWPKGGFVGTSHGFLAGAVGRRPG
jgi:hypothetical protein